MSLEPAACSANCGASMPDGIPPSEVRTAYGIQESWHARDTLHAFCDGHHDYFKCKRCHSILFHDLCDHCRQLIHGYQLLT